MTQHDNILIVPLPDGAFDIAIVNGTLSYHAHQDGYFGCIAQSLPPGDWRIVGRALELTEEECRLLCPPLPSGVRWPNYEHPERLLLNAKDGFFSLLRSYNIDPETNPLILKKEGV